MRWVPGVHVHGEAAPHLGGAGPDHLREVADDGVGVGHALLVVRHWHLVVGEVVDLVVPALGITEEGEGMTYGGPGERIDSLIALYVWFRPVS